MSHPEVNMPAVELRPLKIGNIEIGFPVVQAALSGYSDWPMRVIARRLGASYTICEVMLDQFLTSLKERKRTSHFLHISDEEHPVGGQLMGAEPENFAAGAVKLVQAGFDIIDINFGCPVKKVLGRCRGGFHLSQPDIALEIVRRTREAVPDEIPVTVKMRRGIDDTAESYDNFFEILDGAFDIVKRSQSPRRRQHHSWQRRFVYGARLFEHDRANRCRRRHRRSWGHRQSMDFQSNPSTRGWQATARSAIVAYATRNYPRALCFG